MRLEVSRLVSADEELPSVREMHRLTLATLSGTFSFLALARGITLKQPHCEVLHGRAVL